MGQPIVTLIGFNRPHSEWIFGNHIGRLDSLVSKQLIIEITLGLKLSLLDFIELTDMQDVL